MKFINIFIFLSLVFLNNAESKSIDEETMRLLEATEIISLTDTVKTTNNFRTPYVVRYLKNKDVATSCALLSADEFKQTYEMISPSDGMLGNCHSIFKKPLITAVVNQIYATYIYSVEDPRREFTVTYQVAQLLEKGFNICKEDTALSESIKKLVENKKRLAVAISISLKKIGCTGTPSK